MPKRVFSNITIDFFNSTKSRINKRFVLELVNDIFVALENNKRWQIGVNIVGEQRIKNLNKLYRNKDKVTDILSFAENDVKCNYKKFFNSESLEQEDLGEMFICWQKVENQAKKLSWTKKKTFTSLVVHGILHLLGYDHIKDIDAEKMQQMEQKIIAKFIF